MATKKTLTVEIVGDSGSAEASILKLATSLEKAEQKAAGASITWTKILGDLDKMKAAASAAADATDKLANVGNKSAGPLMTGIENLLRGMGNNQASSAAFNAVADGLESVGGKAILAGAGMAVAGAAVVKLGIDATKSYIDMADAVRQFQAVSGASAQQASVFLNAASAMGISTDALSRGIGLMSVSMDQNKTKLAEHGLATVRDAQGNADLVATFQAVIAKIHDTTDAQQQDVIAREAFGRSWQQIATILHLTDEQMAALIATAKRGPILDQKNEDAALKLKESMGGVSLEVKKLEIGMAEAFGPIIQGAIKITEFNIHLIASGMQALIDSLQAVAKAGEFLHIPGAEAMYNALKDINVASTDASAGISTVPPKLDDVASSALNATTKIYSLADAYDSAKKAFTDYLAPQTLGIQAADSYDAAMSSLDQTIQSAADSTQAAGQKADTGASQIASAMDRITQAQESVAGAQENYRRAVEDAGKSVADAEKQSADQIVQAQKAVTDAEKSATDQIVQAEKAVTDARQRAADAAVSSARAVQDAQQGLLDAESAALDEANPFAAQRKREEAGLKLTRAQEDQSKQQRDSAQSVQDAQDKLAQVQIDAAQKVQDAQEKLAQATVDGAAKRAQAEEDAGRRIQDAQKGVETAVDAVSKANEALVTATDNAGAANDRAAQKVDSHKVSQQQYDQAVQATIDATPGLVLSMAARGASMDDINTKLQSGYDHLKTQGDQLGLNTTMADIYGAHVDAAAQKVLGMNTATYDLFINLQAIGQQLHIDPGILAGEAAAAGINVDTLKPTHDVGGWLPTGVSLAVNRTGVPERVLAPGESSGGRPVIEHHWHVGAIISDRDLADIVARAMKRGNVGFGNN